MLDRAVSLFCSKRQQHRATVSTSSCLVLNTYIVVLSFLAVYMAVLLCLRSMQLSRDVAALQDRLLRTLCDPPSGRPSLPDTAP